MCVKMFCLRHCVTVMLAGDIFGPSLENLDKLIKMPYGCGEQNMLNFAPAVFAAVYMNATNRFIQNTEFQDKIKRTLRTGLVMQLLMLRNMKPNPFWLHDRVKLVQNIQMI